MTWMFCKTWTKLSPTAWTVNCWCCLTVAYFFHSDYRCNPAWYRSRLMSDWWCKYFDNCCRADELTRFHTEFAGVQHAECRVTDFRELRDSALILGSQMKSDPSMAIRYIALYVARWRQGPQSQCQTTCRSKTEPGIGSWRSSSEIEDMQTGPASFLIIIMSFEYGDC